MLYYSSKMVITKKDSQQPLLFTNKHILLVGNHQRGQSDGAK